MNHMPGSVVLIRFPFSESVSAKKRPALLLETLDPHKAISLVIVAMITSRIDSPAVHGDYLIRDWKKAGLLHPSKLRLGKIATLDSSLILQSIGALTAHDIGQTKNTFKTVFQNWTV